MDVAGFLRDMQALPGYGGQIAHVRSIPEREPAYGELREPLSDADPGAPSGAPGSSRCTPTRPRRSTRSATDTTSSSRRHRPAARASATTCRCSTRSQATGRRGPCSCFPTKALARDQSRGIAELAPARPHSPRRLRRRHPGAGPRSHPAGLASRHHQSGHAAPRDSAEPPGVVRPPQAAAVRRRGRGPRVPGRLRLPGRQRAAEAAPAVPPVRRRPPVHHVLGHARQPRRARRAPHGPAVPGRRRRRRALRRQGLSCSGTRP